MVKTFFFGLVSLLLLSACVTKEERAAQLAETMQRVSRSVADQHYKIDVQSMSPSRGGHRQVSYGFFLEVKGDTLVSYLPYFGRAYSVPYGGSGKGLNFTEHIKEYSSEQTKKGQTLIRMRVENEEDNYLFTIYIYDSGQATINLRARERESISYSGELHTL